MFRFPLQPIWDLTIHSSLGPTSSMAHYLMDFPFWVSFKILKRDPCKECLILLGGEDLDGGREEVKRAAICISIVNKMVLRLTPTPGCHSPFQRLTSSSLFTKSNQESTPNYSVLSSTLSTNSNEYFTLFQRTTNHRTIVQNNWYKFVKRDEQRC